MFSRVDQSFPHVCVKFAEDPQHTQTALQLQCSVFLSEQTYLSSEVTFVSTRVCHEFLISDTTLEQECLYLDRKIQTFTLWQRWTRCKPDKPDVQWMIYPHKLHLVFLTVEVRTFGSLCVRFHCSELGRGCKKKCKSWVSLKTATGKSSSVASSGNCALFSLFFSISICSWLLAENTANDLQTHTDVTL